MEQEWGSEVSPSVVRTHDLVRKLQHGLLGVSDAAL